MSRESSNLDNFKGKFLDTPGARRNGASSSHIYDGPYHKFNEWTLS